MIDFQSLVGDAVDNVPGVQGRRAEDRVEVAPAVRHARQPHRERRRGARRAEGEAGAQGRDRQRRPREEQASSSRSTRRCRFSSTGTAGSAATGTGRSCWSCSTSSVSADSRSASRKTLASSGAKKNAEALATAGLAPQRPPNRRSPMTVAAFRPRPLRARPRLRWLKPAKGKGKGEEGRQRFAGMLRTDRGTGAWSSAAGTGARAAAAAIPTDTWSYDGYETIDTEVDFDRFLARAEEAEGVRLRPRNDRAKPGQRPDRRVLVRVGAEGRLLPAGARPEEDAKLDPDKTLAALKPIFENPKVEKRNHNIKFDQIALAAAGVKLAGVAGDSMIAHYLLEPGRSRARARRPHASAPRPQEHRDQRTDREGQEADHDGQGPRRRSSRDTRPKTPTPRCNWPRTFEPQLAEKGFRKLYDEVEVPLIGILAEMELLGIRVDVPFLEKLGVEMGTELAVIEKDVHALAGREFNVGSLKELQKILFEEMKLPVQKRTGIKNEPSTDQESLERLAALGSRAAEEADRVPQAHQAEGHLRRCVAGGRGQKRARSHVVQSGVGRNGAAQFERSELAEHPGANRTGGAAPQGVHPARRVEAHHGRLFADRIAAARALLRRRDAARGVRGGPRRSHRRRGADLQGEGGRRNESATRDGEDGELRRLYGMSAMGLSARLSIPKGEAEPSSSTRTSPATRRCWSTSRTCSRSVRKTGEVHTMLGRKRRLDPAGISPQPRYQNRGQAEREAINYEIQGSAADLIKRAMLAVHRGLAAQKLHARMLLTVHDELVFEAPPKEVAAVAKLARDGNDRRDQAGRAAEGGRGRRPELAGCGGCFWVRPRPRDVRSGPGNRLGKSVVVGADASSGGKYDVGNSRNPGRGVPGWSAGDHRGFWLPAQSDWTRVLLMRPGPIQHSEDLASQEDSASSRAIPATRTEASRSPGSRERCRSGRVTSSRTNACT